MHTCKKFIHYCCGDMTKAGSSLAIGVSKHTFMLQSYQKVML